MKLTAAVVAVYLAADFLLGSAIIKWVTLPALQALASALHK